MASMYKYHQTFSLHMNFVQNCLMQFCDAITREILLDMLQRELQNFDYVIEFLRNSRDQGKWIDY